MVNTDNICLTVVKNLKKYLGIPIVESNQNAKMPKMPYGRYTITTPATANNGTYGEYEDNIARKPVKQIWSLTFEAKTNDEALKYANKARSWIDYAGRTVLTDNDVIVESVGAIGDRGNLLTVDYQYAHGFDVTFWAYDEIEMPEVQAIESIDLNGVEVDTPTTVEELTDLLEKRLSGEVVDNGIT